MSRPNTINMVEQSLQAYRKICTDMKQRMARPNNGMQMKSPKNKSQSKRSITVQIEIISAHENWLSAVENKMHQW